MKQVIFQKTTLSVVESSDHVFLLSSKDVAFGYGVTVTSIREHKSKQSEELIEGKHFIIDRSYRNTPKTMWTKRGIVRLGFFIKSEKAKAFRDWAEDYITVSNTNSELEELKKIILAQNRLIAEQPTSQLPSSKSFEAENKHLRKTLVSIHNRYHTILHTCSPILIQDELRKMTNLFQLIASGDDDNNNLNTKTIARHRYF